MRPGEPARGPLGLSARGERGARERADGLGPHRVLRAFDGPELPRASATRSRRTPPRSRGRSPRSPPLATASRAALARRAAAPRGRSRRARAHLGSYLGCLSAADARDEGVQREVARLARLRAALAKRYARARAALGGRRGDASRASSPSPRSPHARYFLTRLREEAARRMPAELEELAADLEVTGLAAWSRLYDQISGSSVRPRGARRGAAARAGLAGAEPARRCARRAAPRRARRREPRLGSAGRRRRRVPERDRGHAARALPAPRRSLPRAGALRRGHHARHARRDARRRSPRAASSRAATCAARPRSSGRARLGFQDLEAPLPLAAAARVSFDDARERVLAAFGRSPPRARRRSPRGAFARRWIDWSPRPGKRPGGFCTHLARSSASRASSSPSAARRATSRRSPTSSATPSTAS